MKTVKSEIKLDEQGFNEMPGRESVEEALKRVFKEAHKPVDIIEGESYWKNDHATLVIQIDEAEIWRFGEKESFGTAIALARMVQRMNVDEFDSIKVGGKTIIRFWWD